MLKALYSFHFLPVIFLIIISEYIYPKPVIKVPESFLPLNITQSINHAPVVKIILPSKNAAFVWNTWVPYSVEVTDFEDGESKYQEILSNEVIVKLKFVSDAAKATAYLKQKKFRDTVGLSNMVVSNCFNCHAVKTKLAGPSFQEISNRYKQSNFTQLVNHIKNGSNGIWGKEVMPTHPELTDTVARQMVKWILNYANDPGLNYFIGLQGAIPLRKPTISTTTGIFIVMAFYTDHGADDFREKRITGSDQISIQMK